MFELLLEARELYLQDVILNGKRYDRYVDDFINSHRYINCNSAICRNCHEKTTTVLLETMAGKGTEVGSHFEELREILDRVTLSDFMGVCLDTCHVFDAGYDIVNDLDGVLAEFDRVIGLNRLKAVHMNDSIFGLSSHKDRHAKIGEGKIGTEAFRRIINHPVLRRLPFYLETPNELPGYKAEIELLRAMVEEN